MVHSALSNQSRLIETLLRILPKTYPDAAVELLETHISWVILCGSFAFKIKKSITLEFLDFSTLAKRQFYCNEELRLNARLAPNLYLSVVPITGTIDTPAISGEGPVIEYAVKMRRFAQSQRLDNVLKNQQLDDEDIDGLSVKVASFHSNIAATSERDPSRYCHRIEAAVEQNFSTLTTLHIPTTDQAKLAQIHQWCADTYQKIQPVLGHRLRQGFVRECHGDLHLGNMARIDQDIVIFDGIEFNPSFYWIDVISDIAFCVMDLDKQQCSAFAWQFLNRYLEITGDYPGLAVLPYFLVYRAMVRAKVERIRLSQPSMQPKEPSSAEQEYSTYIQLALNYIRTQPPILIMVSGFSGSGKTTLCKALAPLVHAVHIRSDVERRRIFQGSITDRDKYSSSVTETTYNQLAIFSETILNAGISVLVDATFLRETQRQIFSALAERLGVPHLIIQLQARNYLLEERVTQRLLHGNDYSDANRAVVVDQMADFDPLTSDELKQTLSIRSDSPFNVKRIWSEILAKLN